VALLQPLVVLHDFEGAEHGLHAGAVRAVGVGKVAGGVDLMGLDLAQQLDVAVSSFAYGPIDNSLCRGSMGAI
jgi:hypothetical protein